MILVSVQASTVSFTELLIDCWHFHTALETPSQYWMTSFMEPDSEDSGENHQDPPHLRVRCETDDVRSVVSEAETEADLQEIKAKTMYRMVEDITLGSGTRHKVLFLTNKQARLLANTPGSIKRVLEAFEIPTPKLVIRFLQSTGGTEWTKGRIQSGLNVDFPFQGGLTEALQAEQRLYQFMEDVLVPLAAETNALILVSATEGTCMLTSALAQALQLHRPRFGKSPPFSVTGLSADFDLIYNNDDPAAKWREFSRAVSSWRRRHRTVMNDFFAKLGGVAKYDISPAMAHYILCDAINENDNRKDYTAFSSFTSALIQHLMENVPCIALKAGRNNLLDGDESSLGNVVACLESGCPSIIVNVRAWPSSVTLPEVQGVYQGFLDTIGDIWDFLDCNLIYLLFQALENSQNSIEHQQQGLEKHRKTAVRSSMEMSVAKAKLREELQQVLRWFVSIFDEGETRSKRGNSTELTQSRIALQHKRAMQMAALLKHQHLHVADCSDLEECKRLIRELVRLDRLPKQEEAEALDLLEEAWGEHDTKNYLAGQYKFYSKVSYIGLLVLSGLAVTLSIGGPDESVFSQALQEHDLEPRLLVFYITLLAGATASISTIMSPTARWRVLRSKASFLLSVIWQYRTRTKAFAMATSGQKLGCCKGTSVKSQ